MRYVVLMHRLDGTISACGLFNARLRAELYGNAMMLRAGVYRCYEVLPLNENTIGTTRITLDGPLHKSHHHGGHHTGLNPDTQITDSTVDAVLRAGHERDRRGD